MKDIPTYEGRYVITKTGKVISIIKKHPKILKGFVNKGGYKRVFLTSKNGIIKSFFVHRLVALVFIPTSDFKKEVNHKDFNKLNNRIENLEWCTRAENSAHFVTNYKNRS